MTKPRDQATKDYWIDRYMSDPDLTLHQVAQELGVTQQTVWRWKADRLKQDSALGRTAGLC